MYIYIYTLKSFVHFCTTKANKIKYDFTHLQRTTAVNYRYTEQSQNR